MSYHIISKRARYAFGMSGVSTFLKTGWPSTVVWDDQPRKDAEIESIRQHGKANIERNAAVASGQLQQR